MTIVNQQIEILQQVECKNYFKNKQTEKPKEASPWYDVQDL